MKNFIKKWLGIDIITKDIVDVKDVLIDPKCSDKHLGSEIDRKVCEEDFADRVFKYSFSNQRYKECFKCGCIANICKMTAVPKLEKDVQERGVFSPFNLDIGIALMTADHSSIRGVEDRSVTIYYCKHCKK